MCKIKHVCPCAKLCVKKNAWFNVSKHIMSKRMSQHNASLYASMNIEMSVLLMHCITGYHKHIFLNTMRSTNMAKCNSVWVVDECQNDSVLKSDQAFRRTESLCKFHRSAFRYSSVGSLFGVPGILSATHKSSTQTGSTSTIERPLIG